jgi:hypothetical protein
MTPLGRRAYLLTKGVTVSDLARRRKQQTRTRTTFAVLRKQLSMCLNGEREYPELRKFIARETDSTVEQLFGSAEMSLEAA